MCEGSTESPITGAKMTATNHEAMSAMATTVNREKQYCPVLLAAKPIGRKPKMVTSVPVSMEKAVEVKAKVAAFTFSMPSSILEIIISIVIMASSTRRPSAMMSAPKEMRCKLRSIPSIPRKTMARTRGMEIATTRPALRPRLRKLTTSTMAIASRRASVKPPIASRTTSGWSETSLSSMPTGSRCIRRSAASCRPSPKVRLLPPTAC